MKFIRKIKNYFADDPLRHGHLYRDKITGEKFKILSIAGQVHIERYDANAREEWSSSTEHFKTALRTGTIEHLEQQCKAC